MAGIVRLYIFIFFSLLRITKWTFLVQVSFKWTCKHKRGVVGFMTEKQYLSCLHYQMLSEGGSVIPMPVPVVLPVTDDVKAKIEGKPAIALKKESGEVTACWMTVRYAEIRYRVKAS